MPDGSIGRFVAYYGSDHIAETFLFLLRACSGEFGFDREHYFPFQDANLSDPQHFAVLDDLKVRACAFPPSTVEDVEFSQPYDIVLDGTRYSMNITQAGYLAPLALFQCDLLGPGVYVNTRHALHYLMDDVRPFDYMGKEVMETAPQIAGRAKDMARKTVGPTGDDAVPMSELAMEVDMGDNLEKDRDRTEEDSAYSEVASVASVETSPTPLHELVAASIGAVRDIELCRTLLSQIIIVGGSAKFKGFIEECEDRCVSFVAEACGMGMSDGAAAQGSRYSGEFHRGVRPRRSPAGYPPVGSEQSQLARCRHPGPVNRSVCVIHRGCEIDAFLNGSDASRLLDNIQGMDR